MSEETATAEQGSDASANAAYDLLNERLRGHADLLAERANKLDADRLETFGASRFEVAATERVRTENNSIPRDIVAVGDSMLFGYNVVIGLKPETSVDDVFALHRYEKAEDGALSLNIVADDDAENWLHDPSFLSDFAELYRFYKDARLTRLQRREGRLLAVFQIGSALTDRRVFRWQVTPDGDVSYMDNRGDRDFDDPKQFDFEWERVTRDDFTDGAKPYMNIADKVFVDPTGGKLTIRVENNTPEGETLLSEPVDARDQSLADCEVNYAVFGDIVVLNVLPYGEDTRRGFVVNTFARTADRNDAVTVSCHQIPEDHGIITAEGFVLRQGDTKRFDIGVEGMMFDAFVKSPNGEDVMYVFHEPVSGISVILSYNVIRRDVGLSLIHI